MANYKNICGKSRSYVGKDGQTHYEWVRVGRLITGQDGNAFIAFEKYINPAGFINEKGEIIFSVFEPKAKDEGGSPF